MQWLLIGYMFLFIHRPFEVWPALGEIHLERIYMAVVLVCWLVAPGKRWLPNWQHLACFGFALAVLVCWGLSPWMDQGQLVVENYFKILVFYVLLVTVVSDERKLKQVLVGLLCVMTVYLLHSLREFVGGRHTYRMGIARMIGVDATHGDPNTFGASILFVLPFVAVFWARHRDRWLRAALAAYVALSVGCLLLTGSRSALLGLAVWAAIMIWRSQAAWRWAALAVLLSPAIWFVLPDYLQTRFETIVDPSVGPENARVSGEGRLEGFFLGFELLERSPASGVGPGAWKPATGRKLESHNLYGQLFGEMGLFGAAAFAGLLGCFWMNLRWLRRKRRRLPEGANDFSVQVGRAVGVALFLMLFEGNFGHNLFRFNWLWYGGFLVIACHCARTKLRREVGSVVWSGARPPLRLWRAARPYPS